jgi:dephospho-CoA kinase
VRRQIRQWWGERAFRPDGVINRGWIARRVFSDSAQRERLERLLHPWVNTARERIMAESADDAQVLAYVWDTPLLFETDLDRQCDRVVFVETPVEVRLERVRQSRGWDRDELLRRENLQLPLDRKREMSDYTLDGSANAAEVRRQVRNVLSHIQAEVVSRPDPR